MNLAEKIYLNQKRHPEIKILLKRFEAKRASEDMRNINIVETKKEKTKKTIKKLK